MRGAPLAIQLQMMRRASMARKALLLAGSGAQSVDQTEGGVKTVFVSSGITRRDLGGSKSLKKGGAK